MPILDAIAPIIVLTLSPLAVALAIILFIPGPGR